MGVYKRTVAPALNDVIFPSVCLSTGGHLNGSVQANGGSGQLSDLSEGEAGDMLAPPAPDEGNTTHLERRVGLFSGVALIVGTMIGE